MKIEDTFMYNHSDRCAKYYAHAREKHPYFCDWIIPSNRTPDEIKNKIATTLTRARRDIRDGINDHILGWDDLLNCEVWEVFEALANGDKAHAVEELYHCIAVCLRAIDVIEGRQKLGKPQPISGDNAEK